MVSGHKYPMLIWQHLDPGKICMAWHNLWLPPMDQRFTHSGSHKQPLDMSEILQYV